MKWALKRRAFWTTQKATENSSDLLREATQCYTDVANLVKRIFSHYSVYVDLMSTSAVEFKLNKTTVINKKLPSANQPGGKQVRKMSLYLPDWHVTTIPTQLNNYPHQGSAFKLSHQLFPLRKLMWVHIKEKHEPDNDDLSLNGAGG